MSDTSPRLDRRHLLGGAAVLGAAPLLAACGSDEEPTGSASTGSSSPSASDSPTPTEDQGSGNGSGGGDELVAAADVPVGGGVVLDPEKVVVTQPTEGEFKAFTAICTHQGCPVQSVEDNKITCPCHGSQFSAEDGSVLTGPASGPLTEIAVAVKGGSVLRS